MIFKTIENSAPQKNKNPTHTNLFSETIGPIGTWPCLQTQKSQRYLLFIFPIRKIKFTPHSGKVGLGQFWLFSNCLFVFYDLKKKIRLM